MIERRGPIEDHDWADRLTARVLSAAGDRVHGYEIEADLAPNYSFAELFLTALTGDAPTPEHGRAFEIGLSFAASLSPGSMPVHVAGLSRLVRASAGAVVATAALGLSERAQALVDRHAELIEWLAAPEGEAPRADPSSAADDASVSRLRRALEGAGVDIAVLGQRPTRSAALLALFHRCGLTRPEQLVAAVVFAGMATATAEALAVPPLSFPLYPLKVPDFRYVEDGEEGEGDEERQS